jgi:hypothetical protein
MNPCHEIAATASPEAREGQEGGFCRSFMFFLSFPGHAWNAERCQVASLSADRLEPALLYSVACLLYSMCRPLLPFWSSTR